MAPEFAGIALREGLCPRPSTVRLADRKHLAAVVKLLTRRSPTANLGIDMPKARLHLIVCSDDIGPEARRRRSDRSFRPSAIDGGKRSVAVPAVHPWQALLELFDLGLLVSRTNYLAFVAVGLAARADQAVAANRARRWIMGGTAIETRLSYRKMVCR